MPGDLVTQRWLPRDWQTLWPLLLGEPAAMPTDIVCIPSVLSVTGEFDEDAAPQEEECPSVGSVVNSLLDQVVPRVANARSTLLITGALGNIGLSLLRRLLACAVRRAEWQRRCIDQRGNDSYSAIESWRVIAVDIRDESYIPTDLRPHLKSRRLVFKIGRHQSTMRRFSRLLASSEAANVRGVVHSGGGVARRRLPSEHDALPRCQHSRHRARCACHSVDVSESPHCAVAAVHVEPRGVWRHAQTDVVDEASVQNPHNVYGASKAFAETYVRTCDVEHGYRSVVVRLSNVYGSWEDNQHARCAKFSLSRARQHDAADCRRQRRC
jgi:nucleoside-diphosphate-sugar epimerase